MKRWWQGEQKKPWLDVPASGAAFAGRTRLPERSASEPVDLSELEDVAEKDGVAEKLRAGLELAVVRQLLGQVFAGSGYLRSLILRDPARLAAMLNAGPEQFFHQSIAGLRATFSEQPDMAGAMTALRRFKSDVALLTGLADIGGLWPLTHVTGALSEAADVSVSTALDFLFAGAVQRDDWLGGGAEASRNSGLFVLGMGKYGAGELNYSSDIDLIVFFDPEKAQVRDGLAPQQFYVRLVRDLVKLIQDQTPDGYVFRVDLRLRPDPGSTQVAISTDAALIYYENYGQNWERAAFIKARPVAGDQAAGDALLQELDAYVWRKYLDYAAVADVHAMKRQIHAFKGFGEIAVAGHDVKLGRGGIREIEFFVQTQQLIAGGRQPDLRDPRTLVCLERLCERAWITAEVRDDLHAAYIFLRMVEHRLQMVADAQTHTLPSNDETLEALARFAGFSGTDDFSAELRRHLECVQAHYGALFEDVPELAGETGNLVFAGEADDPGTLETLSAMGFAQPSVVLSTMRGWHHGRYRAMMSERARESLTEFQPLLIEALAKTGDPDRAFLAFDRFLSDLPAGVQLFSLLRNNPNLLRLVADVMGTAPRLARILGRRSRTLEAILDPGFFGYLPDAQELSSIIGDAVDVAEDFGDLLDRARVVGHEQSFLIGVQVLSGSVTATQAGEAYTRLADALVEQMTNGVTAELRRAHGDVPGGAAVVVGMGKLGGHEMTASSDLDLILVYDFEGENASSDGKRPLMAGQYYSRLTQRLITSLSSSTSEGELYEVDMRLRPSGNSGPVATRLSSFADYQARDAWTWEHMALIRARCIAGPDTLRERIDAVMRETLTMPRDRQKIADDVREMRGKLARERGTDNPWDLKLVRGGLVDVEFIVQFLQLVHAHAHPDILERNTVRAIAALGDAGLLSAGHASRLRDAAALQNALTQVLRLCVDGSFEQEGAPDGLKALLAQAAGEPDFDRVDARLLEAQQAVQAIFDEIIC
ncbi:MAG: bifunctional [glutamine synthetase] adenylyltransferase/[glutamine synthetase]-adenylyl-L-tyrosine phosphorylase [Hyphomicrobiaceae bacterium]